MQPLALRGALLLCAVGCGYGRTWPFSTKSSSDANGMDANGMGAHTSEPGPREQFCLLTMADEVHRRKYESNLKSHACYAQRHSYISAIEGCAPFHPGESGRLRGKVSLTLRKHDVLRKWAGDPRCDWLVWALRHCD